MNLFIQRVWRWLLSNVDILILLVITLPLAYFGIAGLEIPGVPEGRSLEVFEAAILAVLSLLAIILLRNRQTDESIQHTLEKLQHGTAASDFFRPWDDGTFVRSMEVAKNFSMLATVNHHFMQTHIGQLRSLVQRGGKVRFILLKYDGEALRMMAERSHGVQHELEYSRGNSILGIQAIQRLMNEAPKNNVELKLIDHLPGNIITSLDHGLLTGAMFITFYAFHQPAEQRPSFMLRHKRDGKYFEFFQQYFENIWNWEGAESFDPQKHLPPAARNPPPIRNAPPPTPNPHD
jgi:hypothetical protein